MTSVTWLWLEVQVKSVKNFGGRSQVKSSHGPKNPSQENTEKYEILAVVIVPVRTGQKYYDRWMKWEWAWKIGCEIGIWKWEKCWYDEKWWMMNACSNDDGWQKISINLHLHIFTISHVHIAIYAYLHMHWCMYLYVVCRVRILSTYMLIFFWALFDVKRPKNMVSPFT
jgi:hypothetical protein